MHPNQLGNFNPPLDGLRSINSDGSKLALKACKQSLKKLGVDYLDLYVIHWPGPKTGWPLKKGGVASTYHLSLWLFT